METNEGQPKVGMGPCEELLRVCAAEIGITLEAIEKSAYRDSLLELLERAAVAKIRAVTEAGRRADNLLRSHQNKQLQNMASANTYQTQSYCSG